MLRMGRKMERRRENESAKVRDVKSGECVLKTTPPETA
jgi:hypothetical protein